MTTRRNRVVYRNGSGNSVHWKQLAVFLIAVLVSGSGFWLMDGRDHVKREELERFRMEIPTIVEASSSYTRDRNEIFYRFDTLKDAVEAIDRKVEVVNSKLDAKQ